ncbi:porphobilinogen deaminase [Tothia fuscella]|uniref:Porphobilinogen deaminase n=1 Tax=Tothia fuscella TaxID=1048955 RepID=A0A9P4NUD5_9PEZI|nr:porphobilinogen deaminase [Tothia fuscella]
MATQSEPVPQSESTSTTTKTLRVGTRRSQLARIQTDIVVAAVHAQFPEYKCDIHAIDPLGDRDKITALYAFNAKSLWTEELEVLLEGGELDFIVHSLKDMPTQLPTTLSIGAIFPREDPRDALVLSPSLLAPSMTPSQTNAHDILNSLPKGSIIGTSSLRRSAQLKRSYPHLDFADVRGNVPTRLRKLDDPSSFTDQVVPQYAALILAAAGLMRLGLGDRITKLLSKNEGGCLHAVGQGAIGVEVRTRDENTKALIKKLGCWDTTRACLAERSLMRTLEGGCSVPIGVETEWPEKDSLLMRAVVVSLDGSEAVEAEVVQKVADEESAEELGREVARILVKRGAGDILGKIVLNRNIIAEQGAA